MINMDMVGRLNDSSKTITVGGFGTSPAWNEILYGVKKPGFNIKIDSSGTGPSDHTSFYRKNIPVLFFFTGLHSDYHRPSDDAARINYNGELQIVNYINTVVQKSQDQGKLAFTKTREQQTSTSARFSVSMGIMPDYTFSGAGVKVDGVSEGRPAIKAGIQTGDIVTQMGDYKVNSVEAYMQALGKFKKGDAIKVVVKRGAEEKTFDIVF
jgi:C-terminal processing protease CtpA/Prc